MITILIVEAMIFDLSLQQLVFVHTVSRFPRISVNRF